MKPAIQPLDFSGQDIRGRSFRGTDLQGACFAGVRAGIKPVMQFTLVVGAVLAVAIAALIGGYASALPALFLHLPPSPIIQLLGLMVAVSLPLFLIILWREGPGRQLAIAIGTVVILTAVVAYGARGGDGSASAAAVLFTIVTLFAVAGVLLSSLALVLLHGLTSRRWWWLPPAIVSLLIALAGLHEGLKVSPSLTAAPLGIELILAVTLAAVLVGLPFLIRIRASRGSTAFQVLRDLGTAISCAFGTSFRGACLDGADFSKAHLAHCDFREGSFHLTRWRSAHGLQLSRLDGTNLANQKILELLVSGNGAGKNYDHLCLRDLNLDAANLEQANLFGADLSGSSLRQANLLGSRLAQAKVYGADFSLAVLSKACIENWAISTDTCFDQVICGEIYLRLPTADNPDPWRKPDNRDDLFQPGDFNDFVAPIIRTLTLYRTQNLDPRAVGRSLRPLDLYHYKTINPAAAVVAIHQLAAHNPQAELELVSLEGKGEEKVHLQAVVTGSASSSALNSQYQRLYEQAVTLPAQQLQQTMSILAEQSEQLRKMETLLSTAKESQTNYYIKAGDISGIVNFGQITGDINN
jgi:uncharacterized protein YjbI with pentapeptide repeats